MNKILRNFGNLIIISLFLFGCKEKHDIDLEFISYSSLFIGKNDTLSTASKKNWQHKDIVWDTVPGVSLDRAYQELLNNKKNEELVIAILDTEIDISHEDLKKHIWKNPNEIANNNIDDDDNGYVDDVHGWNFLGNERGENIIYANNEYVRIVRKYQDKFDLESKDTLSLDYKEYKRALKTYQLKLKEAQEEFNFVKGVVDKYYIAKDKLKHYFPDGDFTMDKLKKILEEKNDLSPFAETVFNMKQYGYSEFDMNEKIKSPQILIEKNLNIEYDERKILYGDTEDISSINYGNNILSANINKFYHGTEIAGVIIATRNNNTGINGVINTAKIMPVCISPIGNEHDKDIATGIRYAVNNGARIINMSFGKNFSLYNNWILDAIKYAEQNDVLIVSSAGNSGYNLDVNNHYYPNDNENNGREVSKNFILVGAISNNIDKSLLAYFSNFGKTDVDIFAPGDEIYTTYPDNQYKFDSGTSLSSALVSGVAALIRSYYPDLKASQVKEIIMKSGVSYNINVEIKDQDGSKKMVPFSELSKSGKVVNAYNALLMAEQVSKK